MKIGAIDIGTNSMRLLVTEYVNGQFFDRQKHINTTRIGQDVDKNGVLSKEAIKRNVEALSKFMNMAKEYGCENVYAMGTSALRDAKNSNEFLEYAQRKAFVDVDIVSGAEEANLGFMGVLNGISEKNEVLVIDIGGGSSEFIVGNQDGIIFSKSENIGALRMMEKFIKNDPPTNKELEDMTIFIKNTIKNTIKIINSFNVKKIVGIGGTITSISAIDKKLKTYSMDKIHNSNLKIEVVETILSDIKNMTLEDRKNLDGLQPKRADIIVSGTLILLIILKELNAKQITVSEFDNLEGLICQKAKMMS